jgi:phenylpropionate dioxygenase-like ring-hydroxylating dioxygenase large terminal subunit
MTPENPSAATRREWYPVARAVDLEHPQQVTLLGRRLVAFRTADGRPRVLLDRCLHRGGTLHRGAVIGDSIECPYHGWQWRGADGRCVYIPPNGRSAPIPKAAVIGAFPAVEHNGLIWTYIADPIDVDAGILATTDNVPGSDTKGAPCLLGTVHSSAPR